MPHQEQQGGQEPRHISSHSDLGRKLPSLNSDVRGRKRGSQKKRAMIDNGLDGDRQDGGQTLHMKGIRWKESGRLAQSGYSKCHNQDAALINIEGKMEISVSQKTNLWYNSTLTEKNTEQIFTSILVSLFSVCLFPPLISEWLWLYRIERWLCIDLVSPLRINVISALCLCRLRGGWWRARLAVRQVGE